VRDLWRRYIDSAEPAPGVAGKFVVVTEHVVPLYTVLGESAKLNQSNIPHLLVPWGLYSVFRTLNFLNKDCNMTHGHLSRASIFVTEAGEWKLGGLELCSTTADVDAAIVKCYRLWNRM
jgi:SCY1-like protein 1